MDKPPAESLYSQIDRLARCILEVFPDEPGKGPLPWGEGAVDVAIRLIRRLKEVEQERSKLYRLIEGPDDHRKDCPWWSGGGCWCYEYDKRDGLLLTEDDEDG